MVNKFSTFQVSVFEGTPASLLKEVILVDDNNDDPSVGRDLQALDKVIVVRNDQREGLIRSRVKAAQMATGEALVFLDSHCEVEAQWLEPLLSEVKDNPKRLACPVIDNINLDNFGIEAVSTHLRGEYT